MIPAFYINLDRQPERRRAIEDSFAQHAPPDAVLTRVAAVDAATLADAPGDRSGAEKGCFLSHGQAIALSRGHAGPALILEDDAMFGPSTFAACDVLIPQAPRADILFLDTCVVDVPVMMNFFFAARRARERGGIELLEIRNFRFASSTSYVVTNQGKTKLLRMMERSGPSIDRPYDLWLRDRIQDGRIRAVLAFPFLTTLSPLANDSQIQSEEGRVCNIVWAAFRRMMFVDFDPNDDPFAELATIPDAHYDAAADAFARIVRVMCSPNYKPT